MACKGTGVDRAKVLARGGRQDNVFFLNVSRRQRQNLAQGLLSLRRLTALQPLPRSYDEWLFKGAVFTLWSHYENIMLEKTVINIHYNCRPSSCMLMLMCFGIQTGLFAHVGVCVRECEFPSCLLTHP